MKLRSPCCHPIELLRTKTLPHRKSTWHWNQEIVTRGGGYFQPQVRMCVRKGDPSFLFIPCMSVWWSLRSKAFLACSWICLGNVLGPWNVLGPSSLAVGRMDRTNIAVPLIWSRFRLSIWAWISSWSKPMWRRIDPPSSKVISTKPGCCQLLGSAS